MGKRKSNAVEACEESSENKRRKNAQKYLKSYTELWPCLLPSKKGVFFVHCTVCVSDFSCMHAGRNDCKRHVESKQHQDYEQLKSNQNVITTYIAPVSSSSQKLQVINAEVLMSEFICQSNLPLSTADTMTKLIKKMCPDSKIAAEIKCGRNKTTAILRDLARVTQKDLADRMRSSPFTISTDGSNDDTSKQFPLVVRTIDPTTKTVNSELLSIPICKESATGENIFMLMDAEFMSRDILWSNCIAFGSDNASVMTGNKKGVIAFIEKKQPSIYLSGCPLHLVHIAAKKAAGCLPPVDDVLVDIYYYFNKSDKRKSEFKDVQDLCDLDQLKMIKHVCTRWLSIGRCIERLLDNWDALKVYFKAQKDLQDDKKRPMLTKPSVKDSGSPRDSKSSSKESFDSSISKNVTNTKNLKDSPNVSVDNGKLKNGSKQDCGYSKETSSSKVVFEKVYMEPSYAEKKVETILSFVRSPTNKLYVLFLKYTLKVYEEILTCLQAEDPKIHILRRSLQKLLRSILVRFVKPSAIANQPLDKVEYHLRYNIKPNSELVIGESATEFIKKKSENHLKDIRIQEFYKNVVSYFTEACDYIINKLPLNEPLLQHAEVADVSLQQSAKLSSLLYFIERFPCLIPKGVKKDTVIEQFVVYQSTDLKTAVGEELLKARMDEQWKQIGLLTDENSNTLFCELSEVMLAVLTIPHSSAHCERVFSTVRKNRTDQRSSLSDDTLQTLLTLKSRAGNFLEKEYSSEQLINLKSAYYRTLNE